MSGTDDIKQLFAHLGLDPGHYQELANPPRQPGVETTRKSATVWSLLDAVAATPPKVARISARPAATPPPAIVPSLALPPAAVEIQAAPAASELPPAAPVPVVAQEERATRHYSAPPPTRPRWPTQVVEPAGRASGFMLPGFPQLGAPPSTDLAAAGSQPPPLARRAGEGGAGGGVRVPVAAPAPILPPPPTPPAMEPPQTPPVFFQPAPMAPVFRPPPVVAAPPPVRPPPPAAAVELLPVRPIYTEQPVAVAPPAPEHAGPVPAVRAPMMTRPYQPPTPRVETRREAIPARAEKPPPRVAPSAGLAETFHRLAVPERAAPGKGGRLRLNYGQRGGAAAAEAPAARDENLHEVFGRLSVARRGRGE